MLYQVGDKVVHPMHGAGVIDSIIQKRLGGVTRDYYTLRLPAGSMMVLIPTDSTEQIGMRPVMDAEAAEKILGEMAHIPVEMTSNWSHRYRENLARLKSGNLLEVARVVKGLMRRDQDRGLSTAERKMLHSARQILVSELVLSQEADYAAMESRVNQALA